MARTVDRDPSVAFTDFSDPTDPRWAPESTNTTIPARVRRRQVLASRTALLDRRMEPGDFRGLPESHLPVDPFALDGTLGPARRGGRGEHDDLESTRGNWSLVEGLYSGKLDPRPRSPLRPGTEGGPPGVKPREVANKRRAKGVDAERGGGIVVSAAPAAWDDKRWPRTRVPGPRYVSVSGEGWARPELRAALLRRGEGRVEDGEDDVHGEYDDRDIFDTVAAGRKAESRWRKAGVVAKLAGGAGGGRSLVGKLLGAPKTRTPARPLTMTFQNGGEEGAEEEDDEESERRSKEEAAEAAIALALALGRDERDGGKTGVARSNSSSGLALAASSVKRGGSTASSGVPSARGGGGFANVAAKAFGARNLAGAWRRKARTKAIAGGSHAVPRFGNGGENYLVNMTDRLYADKGEFQQFRTPLASERSQASSAGQSSIMPPSEVGSIAINPRRVNLPVGSE